MDIPPGYRFFPTDNELLSLYLKPKVNGEALPCDVIVEKKIYGDSANPWQVFDDLSTPWIISGHSKIAYAFTPLTKKAVAKSSCGGGSKKRENYAKKAGCGTWHGQTSREIMEGDRVIGFRRLLSFEINDIDFCSKNHVDLNKPGHWLMHEFVLCGYEDYALCRITVDTSKNLKVKKLCAPRNCKTTTAKVVNLGKKSVSTRCANEIIKTTTDQAAEHKNKQVVLNETLPQDSLASTSCVSHSDQGIVDNLDSSGVQGKECAAGGQALTLEEVQFLMDDNVQGIADNLGSFGVQGKECQQGIAQALTLEQAAEFMMNDNNEDFENFGLGLEELLNFDGNMDATSFDLDSFFTDGSWSDVNKVQTTQNMSCSKTLGKRKAFEAQGLSSSWKRSCIFSYWAMFSQALSSDLGIFSSYNYLAKLEFLQRSIKKVSRVGTIESNTPHIL